MTTGIPITPTKKKLMTSPQNEQKTRTNSTSTVRNSSKTPESHNSNAYDSKVEHSQKGEINITLISAVINEINSLTYTQSHILPVDKWGGGEGVVMEPPPRVFHMLQYFENISPSV